MRVPLIVLFAAALAATPALAQRPANGEQLLKQMHDRYDGKWYRTLTFTQQTTRTLPSGETRHETWYEAGTIPGKLRIDVAPLDSMKAMLFIGDSVILFNNGQRVRAAQDRNELMTLGFDVYGQPADSTAAQLRAMDFDLSKLHEATWKGRPAYVVGAERGDTVANQFWIDKERLVFVREIRTQETPRGPMRLEITFDDYRPLGQGWVAAEVDLRANGKSLQHESYSDIRANVQLPAELYDTETYHAPGWVK